MSETFEIKELGGREVTLRLRGWGLPARPFTLDGEQTMGEERALGSPYTTQQPTGARENQTELTGQWYDIHLSRGEAVEASSVTSEIIDGAEAISVDSSPVRTARQAVDLLDDLRRRGVLVRVSWGHVVRIGRVGRFVQKWQNTRDCDWELSLKWSGFEEESGAAPPDDIDPANALRALTTAANEVVTLTEYPIDNLEPTLLEQVDARIVEVSLAIADMGDTISARVSGATTAVDVFRRGLAVMTQVAEEAELLALEIESRVAATWIANVDPEDLTDVAPGQVLAVLTTNRIATRSARALRGEAVRRRFDSLVTVEEVAAIYIAREGDDLFTISRFHYGNNDGARTLREYNNFPSYALTTGAVVLAPRRVGA